MKVFGHPWVKLMKSIFAKKASKIIVLNRAELYKKKAGIQVTSYY